MQPSIISAVAARGGRRPWLICLDLQREYVVPGRPGYACASAAVADACVNVLAQARARGWRIVHSQRQWTREATFGGLFGAPIEGLRPRITEPVFMRASISAFADSAFEMEMREARGADVYLIGFSLADSCVATAFGAIDAGHSLVLVEDAVGLGGASQLEAAEVTRALLLAHVRTVLTRDLEERALEFAQ